MVDAIFLGRVALAGPGEARSRAGPSWTCTWDSGGAGWAWGQGLRRRSKTSACKSEEANVAVALRQMRNVSLDTQTTIGHVPHTPAHGPPTPPAFIHITRVQYVLRLSHVSPVSTLFVDRSHLRPVKYLSLAWSSRDTLRRRVLFVRV